MYAVAFGLVVADTEIWNTQKKMPGEQAGHFKTIINPNGSTA